MSDEERKRIFSRNLLNVLNETKKSQIDVANAIGVSQQTFNTWCRGVALPRMGKIQLLADYFRINMSDLIEEPAADASSVVSVQLRWDERELLEKYNLLNDLGRNKVYEYVSDLTENEKYIRALEESNEAC